MLHHLPNDGNAPVGFNSWNDLVIVSERNGHQSRTVVTNGLNVPFVIEDSNNSNNNEAHNDDGHNGVDDFGREQHSKQLYVG